MSKQRFRIIFLLFCCSLCFGSNGQGTKVTLRGQVTDSLQKPLPFATVSLHRNAVAQTPLKTTYSDNRGRFQLEAPDSGAYLLLITHTGYADRQLSLKVAAGGGTDLPPIVLQTAPAGLQGLVVTARKPLIEQSDDKITFNAESDPAAKTETAIDLLRKTPFVTVDGDNNIQVNGQSNFRVLLNGRETSMFAQNIKEALKGFPGALISRIEVITNPSAKYDAEGVGGVINIITKKKVAGYNGSLGTYYSTLNNLNQNANLSVKWGKLGVTGYYSYSRSRNQRGGSTSETVPFVPSLFERRLVTGNRFVNNFYNFGNLEISFEADSLNTVSVYGNVSGGNFESRLNQDIFTDFTANGTSLSTFEQDNRFTYPSTGFGGDYIRKFRKNKEQEFTIRFNGNYSENGGRINSVQGGDGNSRFVRNRSASTNREYTVQTDYNVPLSSGRRIETGIKAILRRASSDFESLQKYGQADDFKINPFNTNLFNYEQDVYSGYSSFNFKVKAVSFRTGLRLEHTRIFGNFTSSQTEVRQVYTQLVPNIQATRKWNNTLTTVLSYNMRLQRPHITSLNPFVNNNDSLNIHYGNPELGPQYIHTVSLQGRVMKGKTFAGLTLSGSYSDNMIVQIVSFDQGTGVTATTSANLGRDRQASLSLNMNTSLNKAWMVSVNGNLRYNQIENTSLSWLARSGFSGNLFANSNYKVTTKFTISGSGGFFRSPVTLISPGTFNGWYQVNFGYKFFKEKVSATINFNNFAKKDMHITYIVDNPSFRTTSVSWQPYRVVYMGVTWNFGKLKENVSKKRGVSNDDVVGGQGQ